MVDYVGDTIFSTAADGIDKVSYGMYRDTLDIRETMKTKLMSQFAVAHKKIAELMSSIYILDVLDAPYRALSQIQGISNSVLDVVNQVLTSIQSVSATVMSANQSMALSIQQVEAMRLTKTMTQLNDTYNQISDYQATLSIISDTFSGEDGFPDPLTHLYGEIKDAFEQAGILFEKAGDTLLNGKGDDKDYDKAIDIINKIIEGKFSDQDETFVNETSQAIDIINQLRIQCKKAEGYKSNLGLQLDAFSQGMRRFRDEVTFDFGKDVTIEKIQEVISNVLSNFDKIPTQCKHNPKKYSEIYEDSIAQAININELGSTSTVNPLFDKQAILNYENPDKLTENLDIDECYAKAMQLYSAAKQDIDKILGVSQDLSTCYGSSSTEVHPQVTKDINFDGFEVEIDSLCNISRQISDLGMAMMVGISPSEVIENSTGDYKEDFDILNAQFDEQKDTLLEKLNKVKGSIEDFSFFPFADPDLLATMENFVTAGGLWSRGLEYLISCTLWDLTPESFLKNTPIGYVFLTLRNCLINLIEERETTEDEGFDDLIRNIRMIESNVRKYINDFTRIIETLMGFISNLIKAIDDAIAWFVDMMMAILTICDFPEAKAWEDGLSSAIDIYRDGVSRITTNASPDGGRSAFPPVYTNEPTIRTIDAPTATRAAGLCKELQE